MTTNFETGNQPVTVRRPPPPQPTVNIFHPPTIILCCGSLSADSLHSKKRKENSRSSDRGQSVQSKYTRCMMQMTVCKDVWTYAKLDSFSRASFFYSYKLERSLLLLPSIVNWSCSSGLSDYLQPIAAINDALQSGSEVIKMVFQKRKRRRRSRMNEFKSHHHHHHHRSQLNCETRRWSSTSSSCWMPTYYVRPSSHFSSSSLSVLPTECSSSAAPLVDKSLLPSTAISPPLHHHQRCPRRHRRRRIHVAHPLWLVFEDQHQHLVHMHFVYIHTYKSKAPTTAIDRTCSLSVRNNLRFTICGLVFSF